MVANYGKQTDPGAAQSGPACASLYIMRCSTYFGLADLGFGCPELGSFSLREIESVHLPFGLTIERDLHFETPHPISIWADEARAAGSILGAAHNLSNRLPTKPDPDGLGKVG